MSGDLVEAMRGAVTRQGVERLQAEVAKLSQYEPQTEHYFHAGMYCRKVYRDAGVLVVGKVHRKEHFYVIASGAVAVTTDEGVQTLAAGALVLSKPGTKRAVLSLTPAVCLTFHRTDATTVEEAEAELVEPDPGALFDAHNRVQPVALEVSP